jgi:hypothetical protein
MSLMVISFIYFLGTKVKQKAQARNPGSMVDGAISTSNKDFSIPCQSFY